MQIVIDIPDEYYELYKDTNNNVSMNGFAGLYLLEIIRNGKPLPKGHGDLIDRTELYNQTAEWEAQALEQVNKYHPEINRDEWRWWSAVLKERGAFKHDVADAPTIIEADKEGEDE